MVRNLLPFYARPRLALRLRKYWFPIAGAK
jgi:hypothetical protein